MNNLRTDSRVKLECSARMVTFLFWNLNKSDCLASVGRLVTQHAVDLLVLAESSLANDAVLLMLNAGERKEFHFNPGNCPRIAMFSKYPSDRIRPLHESNRVSIRRLDLTLTLDILLVAAHLPSKLHRSSEEQAFAVSEIARDIAATERKVGHARTLLVGDLNMNPFENGLIAATCLHATMDRRIAQRGSRTVDQKPRPFFYNPMWSLLGDASPGPPGTYYRSEGGHVAYFWHMFDQVLVRPDLLTAFDNETLKILDSDGTKSLVNSSGVPNATESSDHLPILFRLDL
ncbi:MAG TPA: endonuclease/exonuclease/phosphatase family protein [Polyangiaceae bacterium]